VTVTKGIKGLKHGIGLETLGLCIMRLRCYNHGVFHFL